MIAERMLFTAIMTGFMVGGAPFGTGMASNVLGKKVYDLLGSLPVKSRNQANSLLTPQTFMLGKDFEGKDDELRTLHKVYENHKTQHRQDDVIISIRHEEDSDGTRRLADLLYARLPEIRVALTGGSSRERTPDMCGCLYSGGQGCNVTRSGSRGSYSA
ncbi:MAG: hypothetical protein D8M57_14625 [Candidatus Scalindua sp. AMX11]|nr:MAG: hypothetical protein DWQ00_17465 [Candidatus Scalindua sp.]NOG83923.1 hypothetical protein [Planctomycetota bacterium]RZV87995.1 MAG: hypothetical protein EX341_06705 [Candidatus Scalindua sp. SCAELEC01]TDE64143.1 MAG: hypothetical protein D8M57_14625 [Candidatus Scalindua sp. AMX11]